MTVKPLLTGGVIIALLFYTGLLGAFSQVTGSAILKTGLMDAEPAIEENAKEKDFDFDFTIKDLKGNRVEMEKYKGKVIFLNMWATWCGPCRVEMPSIQELYSKVDHSKIEFVMLSLDTDDNHSKVVKYITDKSFSFPVYQPAEFLPKQLQVASIPTTFVIGADGKVKMKKVGTANYDTEEFKAFLDGLAAQKL